MNNTRLLIFTLSLLFFGENIYSQKIFREGYIVKTSGEILNGKIEYSRNQDVPEVCNFKRFDIARSIVYSPKEIKAFGYKNGNRYESCELNSKTTFFEHIVTGKINLYHKGSKFYLDKKHTGIVELKNGPINYSVDGINREYESLPEFLSFITEGKTGTIPSKFNIKNDIELLVISYNKESGNSYYVYNRSLSERQLSQQAIESEAFKNKIGVITGVNAYSLNLDYNLANGGESTDAFLPFLDKEKNMVSGISYERLISRKSDRLSFRIDLLYSRQYAYCYSEKVVSALGDISRNDCFIKYTGLKTPVLLQYAFTGNRLVPFINAGVAYQFILNSSYYHIEELESWEHDEITTSEDNLMQFKPGEISGIGGLGFRTRIFNNLSLNLQARFEYGPGLFYIINDEVSQGQRRHPYIQSSFQSTFMIGLTF